MRSLNDIIIEGLADWGDEELNKKISKQTSEAAIKKEIIDWISENYAGDLYPTKKIIKNKLKITFNSDKFVVDYNGDIYVKNETLDDLTNGVFQWGEVGGNFGCDHCRNLKSLEGCPKIVAKDFTCCACSSLITLEGCPKKVGGKIACRHCTHLKSLKGVPEEIGGSFMCFKCNSLKSLEYCPKKINGALYCYNCKLLKNLEGAPEEVQGTFDCHNCTSLKSLEGAPEKVGMAFRCDNCGTKFTEEDVKKVSKVSCGIYC
jgi:hypothetical protein